MRLDDWEFAPWVQDAVADLWRSAAGARSLPATAGAWFQAEVQRLGGCRRLAEPQIARGLAIPAGWYRHGMGIGAGILLIAIGAILAFAVNWHVSGLDLQVVGWILMIVGVFGVVLFFTFWNSRRTSGNRVVAERRVYDEPDSPPPPGV